MKDRFFLMVDRFYLWIYSFVNGAVYWIFSKKRIKDIPRLSNSEKKEIKKYWKKYRNISGSIHEYKWFKSKDKLDKRIIPEAIWHADVEPYFNNVFLEKAFEDKNYYEFIVGKENSPETIVHCINGHLLDDKYMPISKDKIVESVNTEEEVVCKASMGTSGGKSIKFISKNIDVMELESIISSYRGNFLIQKTIKQHPMLATFNRDSVNTMRLITFMYKEKIHFIYGELRFGRAGSRLDNSASGGNWVLINKEGIIQNEFYKFDRATTDMYVDKEYINPVNEGTRIPGWDKVMELLEVTHYKLAHFGIIYWDVSILENEKPIIIEYNLLDSDAYAYQFGVGPFFGDMTEEVLSEIYL